MLSDTQVFNKIVADLFVTQYGEEQSGENGGVSFGGRMDGNRLLPLLHSTNTMRDV